MSHMTKNTPPRRIRKSHNIIINGPIRINNRTITSSEAEYKQLLNINKKRAEISQRLLIGSGGGNRTARPSGYEPDELPTALPRDIGLQIYGQFLKVQIFIAKIPKFLSNRLLQTIFARQKRGFSH